MNKGGAMARGSIFSTLIPRGIFAYGQEYFDRRLKRFKQSKKLGNVQCERCGIKHENGRWTWASTCYCPSKVVCPACKQIIEDHPVATVILRGDGYRKSLLELTALIKNCEISQRNEHPLSRIVDISTQGDRVTVRMTSIQLAKMLANRIHKTFHGNFVRNGTQDLGVFTIELGC